MTWVLIWAVLVIAGVAFLAVLGRRLWRQAKALTREMSAAADRLGEVSGTLRDLTVVYVPAEDEGGALPLRPPHREP